MFIRPVLGIPLWTLYVNAFNPCITLCDEYSYLNLQVRKLRCSEVRCLVQGQALCSRVWAVNLAPRPLVEKTIKYYRKGKFSFDHTPSTSITKVTIVISLVLSCQNSAILQKQNASHICNFKFSSRRIKKKGRGEINFIKYKSIF